MNSIFEDNRKAATTNGPARHLSQKVCPYCKCKLTVHQEVRGGVCDKLACRTKQLVEFDLRRRRDQAAALWQKAVEYRRQVAQRIAAPDPASLRLVRIPHYGEPIVKQPRERRAEFRAHLVEIIRRAYEEKLDSEAVTRLEVELRNQAQLTADAPVVGASCAVCKGFCCRHGGTRAYLDVAVIRGYLVQNPGLRLGQVLKAYLKRLPKVAFKGSCVYHGADGCGLSPEMRSHICNEYFCNGMTSLRAAIESEGPKTVLLVAADEMKITKSALIEPNGNTTPLDPPANADSSTGIGPDAIGHV